MLNIIEEGDPKRQNEYLPRDCFLEVCPEFELFIVDDGILLINVARSAAVQLRLLPVGRRGGANPRKASEFPCDCAFLGIRSDRSIRR